MAKKTDIDVSSNLDDFGDFDFNVDESGTKKNKVARPSKMKSDYIPAMASGFLSGLKRELANKLPQTAGFVNELDSAFDQIKSMTSSFTSEAGPMVKSLGRSTNRLMPLVKPFMPRGAYNWVTGKLSSIPEDEAEMSPDERMGQQISSDINAAMQGANAADQVRANMGEITSNMRHKAMMGSLGNLGKEMHFVSSYLQTTMTAYMKKDLELSYRQLYTQKDISSTLRATAKLVEVELKHITHNTGLPESVKAEDFKRRGTFVDTIRGQMGKQLSGFISNVKTHLFEQAKDALSMFSDAMSGAADISEMMSDMDGEAPSLKNLMLKTGFSLFGGMAGGKLAQHAAPFLKALGGGGIEGASTFGINKLFDWIREKAENGEFGLASDFLVDTIPGTARANVKFDNVAAKDPNKPVAFDLSTRDAIVSVIPGWLSKIHAVTRDIQDPKTKHAELVYDANTRDYINPADKNGATYKEVAEKLKELSPAAEVGQKAIGQLMGAYMNRGKTAQQAVEFFQPDTVKKIMRVLTNIAHHKAINGFDLNKFDAYANGTGDVDSHYMNIAMEGIPVADRQLLAENLVNMIVGEGGKPDPAALNALQNNITAIAQSSDPAKIANFTTEMLNNATDAQLKVYMEMMKALPENQRFIDFSSGKPVVDTAKQREYEIAHMSNGADLNNYTTRSSMVDAVRDKKEAEMYDLTTEEGRKSMYESAASRDERFMQLMQDSNAQFKEVFEAADRNRTGGSVYNGETLGSLYGDDFMTTYLQQDKELYGQYKTNMPLFAFDTVIASNSEAMRKEHQVAALIYDAFYASVEKECASETDYRTCCSATVNGVRKLGLYYKIASDFIESTSFESMKALAKDRTRRFDMIKNSKAIKSLWDGKSLDLVINANTRGKTGISHGVLDAIGATKTAEELGNKVGSVIGAGSKELGTVAKFFGTNIKEFVADHGGIIGTVKDGFKQVFGSKPVQTAIDTSKGLIDQATGKFKEGLSEPLTDSTATSPLPVPTEDDRKNRIMELRLEDPELTQEEAAKVVDAQIAEEKQKAEIAAAKQAEEKAKQQEAANALKSKVRSAYDTVTDKAKSAFTAVREGLKNAATDLNGTTETAENVAKIYGLLEKRFGNLTEAEIQAINEKEAGKETKVKKGGGFLRALGGLAGGALNAINPFKQSAGAIAAKYKLDASAVESAFHGDFQRYFEYRKEMDVLMASYMKSNSLFGMLGNVAKGAGSVLSGMTKATGMVASGLYKGGGLMLNGLGKAAMYGLGGIGHVAGAMARPAWEATKYTLGTSATAVKKTTKAVLAPVAWLGRKSIDLSIFKKKWFDLYRKDQDPSKEDPLVSVKVQKRCIDKQTGKEIHGTLDINGPLIDTKTEQTLLTEEDWKVGLVDVHGKDLMQIAGYAKSGASWKDVGAGLTKGFGAGMSAVNKLLGGVMGMGGLGKKLLQGAGAVGLHALDFGISGLERLFGFDTSAKKFEKKYKPLLDKLDIMTIYLKSIDHNTLRKTVAGDEDGDGDRDNSYKDQIGKDGKKLTLAESRLAELQKEKDKNKETSVPWWKKIYNILKDPKGALLSALKPLSWIVGLGKFFLFTIPKTLLWTLPKWLITAGIPAICKSIAALAMKSFDFFKSGKLGAMLTIAGAATAGYTAYKAVGALRNDDGDITEETAREAGSLMSDARDRDMNIYRTGKVVTQVERSMDVAKAAKRADEAHKAVENAKAATKAAKRGKQIKAAQKQMKTALELQKKADAALDTSKSALKAAGKASIINISDEASDFAKLLKKCKIDKILDYCTGKLAALKDVAKNFIDGLKKCKSISKVVTWLKTFFQSAKALPVGKFAKVLRFFSLLKGVGKVCFAAINYLMEPAMMAIDGWIRLQINEVASETGDTSIIDEYNEQNKFGWGRGLSAIFTGGLSEVYNLGATAISEFHAANIELGNVNQRMISDSGKDFGRNLKASKEHKDEVIKKDHASFVKEMEQSEVDVSNEEEHTSSWYNIGGHLGEAYANADTRDARKAQRRGENSNMVTNFYKNLEKNQLLTERTKRELSEMIRVAFMEQGAKDRKPWGMAVYSCLCRFAATTIYTEFEKLISDGYALVNGKRRSANVADDALQYIWAKVTDTKSEALAYALKQQQSIDAKAKAEAQAKSIKPAPTAPKPSIDANKAIAANSDSDEKYKNLDAIFGKIDSSNSAYADRSKIVAKLRERGWPASGAYEYGDAIFVFVRADASKLGVSLENRIGRGRAKGTCMLRSVAELRTRYPSLDPNFKCASSVVIDEASEDYKVYYYCVVYKKANLFKWISNPQPQPSSVTPKPAPTAPKEATKADKVIKDKEVIKPEEEQKILSPEQRRAIKARKELSGKWKDTKLYKLGLTNKIAPEDYEIPSDYIEAIFSTAQGEALSSSERYAMKSTFMEYIQAIMGGRMVRNASQWKAFLIAEGVIKAGKDKSTEKALAKPLEAEPGTPKSTVAVPKEVPKVTPTEVTPTVAPTVIPNDSTIKTPEQKPVAEALAESVTATDKKDLTTEQLVQRVAFLENLLTGKNPMTELLSRIADGTDKNNDLTLLNGEAAAGQAKNWEDQYAALKKSQGAQTNLFMKASKYGTQPPKPADIRSMINLNQGLS